MFKGDQGCQGSDRRPANQVDRAGEVGLCQAQASGAVQGANTSLCSLGPVLPGLLSHQLPPQLSLGMLSTRACVSGVFLSGVREGKAEHTNEHQGTWQPKAGLPSPHFALTQRHDQSPWPHHLCFAEHSLWARGTAASSLCQARAGTSLTAQETGVRARLPNVGTTCQDCCVHKAS